MSQSDFVNRGQALVSSGQYQEAVKVCRLGLLGRPTTVEGRVVLGQALLALKRYDEVLAEMRVALELDHSSVPAHALKGEALLRKGDRHAAIEVLEKAKDLAPGDPRVVQLLSEAERVPGSSTAAHPAVGYVRQNPSGTKNYPKRAGSEEETGNSSEEIDDEELTQDEEAYTSPQSLSYKPPREPNGTPPQAVLEVGDKSGTVEVDPELEAEELRDDDPLIRPPQHARPAADFDGPRGSIQRSRKDKPTNLQRPKPVIDKVAPQARQPRGNTRDSAEELDSADIISEDEAPVPMASPSQVRSAVAMPPGPIRSMAMPAQPQPPPNQVPLAQAIAGAPHVMQYQQPMPPVPTASPAARTMALSPAQQQTASAVDALFPHEPQHQQQRMSQTVAPGGAPPPPMPTPPPPIYAPQDPSVLTGAPDPMMQQAPAAVPVEERPRTIDRKTGMRKTRSKFAIVVWIIIGGAVIGGGVFAGLQIRAMRLDGQIDAARQRASDQAKPDTWKGWADARDSVAGIVQASNTPENRAELAKIRGLMAFEFGDGLPEAKTAVDQLKDATGVDVEIARAYVGLASDDVKLAKAGADAAIAAAADDPAAIYVAGLVQIHNGDYVAGTTTLKSAVDKDKDGHALYAVGLARAYAEVGAWDDALAALDKAQKLSPDHPSAQILKAKVLVQGGRITPATASGADVRTMLEKVVAEGGKSLADQTRGVSPVQVALATVGLIRLEFARNNTGAEQQALKSLQVVSVDDQRFGEDATDALLAVGELELATNAANEALKLWPGSRRARISLAEIQLANGKPGDALDTLAKSGDATTLPSGLVVRAEAKLAKGDADGARTDYDVVLKRLPTYERGLIGRARLDLAAGDLDGARKLIEPRVTGTPSAALATVYAQILRATNDPTLRDKARALLEKVTKGPPTADMIRAQLELARIYRDMGDLREARNRYAEAAKANNWDAKLESAVLLIEESDPGGGHDSLEQLLKDAGKDPPGALLVELARARMFVGDDTGAQAALDAADKATGTPKWELDRERARLMYRRDDIVGAGAAIDRALDGCGTDRDTFFLAADVVAADLGTGAPKLAALADKLKGLSAKRLDKLPEGQVVTGILALGAGNDDDAQTAYEAADKLAKPPVPPRLAARITLGDAVIQYDKKNYPKAKVKLETVVAADPTSYTAYLFAIESVRDQEPKVALDYAKKVVQLNASSVYGWYFYGLLAAQLQQPKLLAEAIDKVNALAPTSPLVKELVALRR